MTTSTIYKYLPAQTIMDFSTGLEGWSLTRFCTIEISDSDSNIVEVTIAELVSRPFGDGVPDDVILRTLKPNVPAPRLTMEKRYHKVPDVDALDDDQLAVLRSMNHGVRPAINHLRNH